MVQCISRLWRLVSAIRICAITIGQESYHKEDFCWKSRSLVLQMFSKSGRNYLIKSAYFLRFQQWYIHPDRWTIEGDMTILWSITKLGKSVHRVIWDGPLALSGTSYKGLSQHGIHPSSGAHHLFLKEDKFHSNWLVSHWQQLVCPT